MKTLTIFGFLLVCVALTWLGLNQQETNTHLRALVAENRKLTEAVSKASLEAQASRALPAQGLASLAPPRPAPNSDLPPPGATGRLRPMTRPNGLAPGTDQLGFRTLQDGPDAQSLSSHSADGKLLQRSWGPEQVVGPPNTLSAGDQTTAWAQYTSSGGDEWLHVTFEKPVDIAEVIVRETHNPGAVSRVAAVLDNKQEVTIWAGTEPTVPAPVDVSFPCAQKIQGKAVKIYLDRRRVPGWNEIDAVELIGRDGSRQWAASATVSSAYSISPGNAAPAAENKLIEIEDLRAR